MECTHPFEIIITDDSKAEGLLIKEILLHLRNDLQINQASDGLDLLNILNSRLESGARLPNLIILDLNMPRMNGRKALKALKEDACLKHIPVVVFTCSDDREDIQTCYDNQASGYIRKPWTLEGYEAVLKTIDHYWLSTCELPDNQAVSPS